MNSFPVDEATLILLEAACRPNPDTGQTHLHDFLNIGTRVKSETVLDDGPIPIVETEYEDGFAPWSPQHVILDLVAEICRLRAALREAQSHLRFNTWKDDPRSDKRFAAVHAIDAALSPDPTTSEDDR